VIQVSDNNTIADDVPHWAFAAALAALPLQTHSRLRRLLQQSDPVRMWQRVREGTYVDQRVPEHVINAWRSADSHLPHKMHETCQDKNISVVSIHDDFYPEILRGDPASPAVLFYRGSLACLGSRRVAIIGTRHATRRGRFFSSQLASELSRNAVTVVSGLARGIDVAAHTGVRALGKDVGAPPVAVVASGIDVVYPREHKEIWHYVGDAGLIMSESPPGSRPEAHLFPLRNRILAALSEIVVVVESGSAGGSMITVREAERRGIPVMAVPGAPNDHASVGTNALLRDGCAPVTDIDDVLIALSMDHRRITSYFDHRTPPTDDEATVLRALVASAATADMIAMSLGVDVLHVAVCLGRLENKGWVAHERGWWEALMGPQRTPST
jgi:DNA processing protein